MRVAGKHDGLNDRRNWSFELLTIDLGKCRGRYK